MSNGSLPHIGKFITYEEVTGQRVQMADAIHLLSQLNIIGVIRIVSLLNNCFVRSSYKRTELRQLQNALIAQGFSDELKEKLNNSEFGRNMDVVVFHRHQLLLVLRLALMSCPTEGGKPWDTEAQQLFAQVCLMANDFVGARAEEFTPDATVLEAASNMIPMIEMMADHETISLVGRAYDLWLDISNIPSIQTEKDFVPIAERFMSAHGISLESFIHGLYFLLAKAENFNLAHPNPLEALLVNPKYVIAEGNGYSQATFEKVLSIVSCTLSTLKDKALTEPIQSQRSDLTMLRRYPFIKLEADLYVCIDRGFLRRYFTDGIYWLIYGLLSTDEQKSFLSFFGKVFKIYVERLLRYGYTSGVRQSKLHSNLEFSERNGEVCDVLIESKDACVIIETKGSLMTTRAKYSGDVEDLERDLRAKFVTFQSGKNKGIGQLANSIKKLLNGISVKNSSLDIQKFRWIYPVLVTYEAAVSGPFISKFFEDEFREGIGELAPIPAVKQPCILTIEDLETFTAMGRGYELQYVLSSYRAHGLPAENLTIFIRRYYPKVSHVMSGYFWTRFEIVHNAVIAYFGNSTDDSVNDQPSTPIKVT